jgi:hypothetical protein
VLVPPPEWMDQPGESATCPSRTTSVRVSSGSPSRCSTTASGGRSKYRYTSVRRSCVCAGIVFHTLPGSSVVTPITSCALCAPFWWT